MCKTRRPEPSLPHKLNSPMQPRAKGMGWATYGRVLSISLKAFLNMQVRSTERKKSYYNKSRRLIIPPQGPILLRICVNCAQGWLPGWASCAVTWPHAQRGRVVTIKTMSLIRLDSRARAMRSVFTRGLTSYLGAEIAFDPGHFSFTDGLSILLLQLSALNILLPFCISPCQKSLRLFSQRSNFLIRQHCVIQGFGSIDARHVQTHRHLEKTASALAGLEGPPMGTGAIGRVVNNDKRKGERRRAL